jgi:orotate phosphoribosyltransferase
MSEQIPVSEQVARYLLEIEAIRINLDDPFSWASGWKSPIYCDNRISLSYPQIRTFIKNELINLIRNKFKMVEAIAGVATAGIPQGALVADHLGLPFLYVRAKPKEHGLSNQIEGRTKAGQRVVVIEDLVSTGGSSMNAIEALRNAGVEVLGMASIFSYAFQQSVVLFEKNELPFYSLSDYEVLIDVALRAGYIMTDEVDQLKAWRMDPAHWR